MDGRENDTASRATSGVHCHRRRRFDGKWVQATEIRLGTVAELPNEEAAWERFNELGLKPDAHLPQRNPRITFGELAAHYVKFELPDDQSNATIEKTQATITKYKRYLNNWALPRWQRTRALAVHPFEMEIWLKEIAREHNLPIATLAEIHKIMNLVYRHGQRFGLLPRTDQGNLMPFVRFRATRNRILIRNLLAPHDKRKADEQHWRMPERPRRARLTWAHKSPL